MAYPRTHGRDVSDVLLRLRRAQRRYRRIASFLQKLGAGLSFILMLLSIFAYFFELFGMWIIQIAVIALSIVTTIVWIAYGLVRKILTQLSRRIREARSQLSYEMVL